MKTILLFCVLLSTPFFPSVHALQASEDLPSSFPLPNAQEIETARAGEADFSASPWRDFTQAMIERQEKAFFFAMDLFTSLSKVQRRKALGRFLAGHMDVVLRPAWDVLIVNEPKRLRLILKWLKLRTLELGNAPTWWEIPKKRFAFQFNSLDLFLKATANNIVIEFSYSMGRHEKEFQSHQGRDVFLLLEGFLEKYVEDKTAHLSERNNLELAITTFSFLPSDKREALLEPIIQEIQKENGKFFLDHPFLLKEWPDTEIPEYNTWVEMLRDQAENEADREWAIQRLKELECSTELSSEAPKTGEATL